jgi:hypothetical protein
MLSRPCLSNASDRSDGQVLASNEIERWRPYIFLSFYFIFLFLIFSVVRGSIEFQFQGVCPVSLCKTVNRFIINDGRHKVTTNDVGKAINARELLYVVLRLDTWTGLLTDGETHPRSIFFDKKPSSFVWLSHVQHIIICVLLSLSLRALDGTGCLRVD